MILQIKNKCDYDYTMNGKSVSTVNDQKDLGIIVSNDLFPKKHIESICGAANR